MKAVELRNMSVTELEQKVTSLEENYFRLRCNKTLGQLEDLSILNQTKRDIARAKTILTEKNQ